MPPTTSHGPPSTPRTRQAPPEGNASDHWRRAGRDLVVKALAELAYEGLLEPQPTGADGYLLSLPSGVGYAFRARRAAFGSWRIDGGSVRRRTAHGEEPADDPRWFLTDARAVLGLDGPTTAEALRELTATWAADARMRAELPTAAELADASYVDLEAWQSGHPCMVLNKGRLGFDAADVAAYAPESRRSLRLPWIAVHRDLATYQGVPGLAARRLLTEELDTGTLAGFAAALGERAGACGTDPADYVWLPVHPFHLDAAVRTEFAPYIADGRVVELGEAPDRYRPLASVRTLVNVDHPARRNVKLPLLMRNTLVWRGLPAGPTAAAPAVTSWLQGLRERDPYLAAHLDLLGEVASVAVRHPVYEAVVDAPYRFHELLGAVWREPVEGYLGAGERARTLAALLQVGSDGRALVAELVCRSRMPAEAWLERFASALLPGLLHALVAHGVAFCPHGENTVVVYDADDVPVRVMVKDFAEDVNLLPGVDYPGLPDAADPVLLRWPPADLGHSILSAIFAGHFRFFAEVVERHLAVDEADFWGIVREVLDAYLDTFAEHAERCATFGLYAPEFGRVCLNREHLTGAGFHDRAEKDESFDVIYGAVVNPLHGAGRR